MCSGACKNSTPNLLLDKLNNTDEEYAFDDELERVVSQTVFLLFGVIGIAGLVGNALVVLVVAANPLMRSTTNILIINLAIADLLFVIFCIPATAIDYILPDWPFGDMWCKVVQYMIVVTCHASVYTLVLMSLDRFLAVVHPISSISIRTQRNAFLAIIIAWLVIITTAIPVGITHGEVFYISRDHEVNTACLFLSGEGYSHPAFQISFFLSSYVVPLALISILYMGMLLRLWKAVPGSKVSAESRRGKKRVTRLVVVVVLGFSICWLPIQIVLVLKSLQLYEPTRVTVCIQIIAHVLAYTNSCINPILYAFLSENFRKAFRKIVWCGTPPPLTNRGAPTKSTRTTANGAPSSPPDFL
ncbi:unnamed protein product [Diamesa serratosioi]